MKFFLPLIFLLPLYSFAQWSNNPGLPLRVCPTNSQQFGPWIFPDGSGGQILFWTDNRNGNPPENMKLFAQHLDASGNRLLPDSGKLMVNHQNKKSDYSIARDANGDFWVAFGLTSLTRVDSIVVQKYQGSTLSPVWDNFKRVAVTNSGNFNALYVESIQILPQGDSAYFHYKVTWMGGSAAKFVNRMSSNGEIRFENGKTFAGSSQGGGPSVSILNEDGTLVLVQRNSNGLGTGVNAWKFDRDLKLDWGPRSLTAGTPGLGYEFEVVPDGAGGFVMAYINANSDFMATRMDSSGNFVWTPNHKPICNYSSSQSYPYLLKVGDHFYCSWIDSRPPANNSDVFLQKIDLLGERLWNPDGRRVFRLNSYIPVPKLMADDSSNVIVTSLHNSTGFVAQKVRPDSTFAWPGYGLLICNSSNYYPFYGSYNLSPGVNGNTFVAWKAGDQNSGKIYIAGLAVNGTLVSSIGSGIDAENGVGYFPNPSATGLFTIQLPKNQRAEFPFSVYSSNGREVYRGIWSGNLSPVLDLTNQPAGLYQIKVQISDKVQVIRLLKP